MTHGFARWLVAAPWLVACSSAPGWDTTSDGDGLASNGNGSPTTTGTTAAAAGAASSTGAMTNTAGSGGANGGTSTTSSAGAASSSTSGTGGVTSAGEGGSSTSGTSAGGDTAAGAAASSLGGAENAAGNSNVGGDTSIDPSVDPCEEFSCVDIGSCSVQPEPEGCARVCTLSPTYTFTEASQVERLAELRCDIIDGTLVFSPTSVSADPAIDERQITKFEIETVRRITGALRVESASLTTIHLPNLQWIAGMDIGAGPTRIAIYDARRLESIHLPSLQGTKGDITIASNPSLVTIDMSSLEEVAEGGTSSLSISGNDELLTLNGLPALANATLFITDNPKLPQCAIDDLAHRAGVSCLDCRDNDYAATCE